MLFMIIKLIIISLDNKLFIVVILKIDIKNGIFNFFGKCFKKVVC